MAILTIRFWKSISIQPSPDHYPHISLEIENHYLSFHPPENKTIQSRTKPQGKFIDKTTDYQGNRNPDMEIVLNLDLKMTAAAEKAIEMLKSEKLPWQIWQSEGENAFNCCTVVLLIMKISGLFQNLSLKATLKEHPFVSDAIFQLATPLNISAFYNFSKTSNPDITPEIVKKVAQVAEKKSYLAYFKSLIKSHPDLSLTMLHFGTILFPLILGGKQNLKIVAAISTICFSLSFYMNGWSKSDRPFLRNHIGMLPGLALAATSAAFFFFGSRSTSLCLTPLTRMAPEQYAPKSLQY